MCDRFRLHRLFKFAIWFAKKYPAWAADVNDKGNVQRVILDLSLNAISTTISFFRNAMKKKIIVK